jgi:hypothetical protein
MSREVLLTLLGTLLVVNVGVLISIAFLRRRGRAGAPSEAVSVAPSGRVNPSGPESARPIEGPAEASLASVPEPGLATAAEPIISAAEPIFSAPEESLAAHSPAAVAVADAPSVAYAPSVSLAPSFADEVADTGQDGEETLVAENGHLEPDLDLTSPTGATPVAMDATAVPPSRNGSPTAAGGKRRRSRRFVLPPLEEDGDRSARAIEAFLGEALVSPPLAHPERLHRRRHRARRAPGARASRTSLIVELVGYQELAVAAGEKQAVRLAGALAEALWRSARIGDEVRELEPGRIQLVLDCDAPGADAFAERARASVAPWLAASTVPLGINVTTAAALPGEIASGT